MKPIREYILLPQNFRQSHLKIHEDCIEIGGNSTQFKALLAHHLRTTIPNGNKDNVLLCHACHNAKCSNPNHLYWGSRAENNIDRFEREKQNGTYKTCYQMMLEKYGEEKTKELVKIASSKGGSKGGRNNKGKPKSLEHRNKLSEANKRRNEGNLVNLDHSK